MIFLNFYGKYFSVKLSESVGNILTVKINIL